MVELIFTILFPSLFYIEEHSQFFYVGGKVWNESETRKCNSFTLQNRINERKKTMKKIIRQIKNVLLTALVTIGSIVSTPLAASLITEVNALNASGSYASTFDAGAGLVGSPYSTTNRLGPNSFDCSGFVDYLYHITGIDDTPYDARWTTVAWCNDLQSTNGVTWSDGTLGNISSLPANKGDIIMFYADSSYSPASSQHMGVLADNNTMVSAVYQGVTVQGLTTAVNGHLYVPAGHKDGTYIRIYHLPSDRNITINASKASGNTSITDTCIHAYSLNGAVYGIYKSQSDADNNVNAVGQLTTDTDGKASTSFKVSQDTKQLWYRELTAPKGYYLDSTSRAFNIGDSDTVNLNFTDQPGNDPFRITLVKVSEDIPVTDENTAPLSGAQFTINYYDDQYANLEDLPAKPTRSWIVATKYDNNRYGAMLSEDYLVDGSDPLFYVGKFATIPVGTITVEETKVPDAKYTDENGVDRDIYSITNNFYAGKIHLNQKDGKVIMHIMLNEKGDLANLRGGNEYTVSEKPNKGGFKVSKIDDETKLITPQGNGTFLGTTYQVINKNSYSVGNGSETFQPGSVVFEFSLDEYGKYESAPDALQVGKYTIRESTPPTGYLNAGTTEQTFEITKNGQIVDLTYDTDNSFTEKPIRGGFNIQKNDTDTVTYAQGDTDLTTTFRIINTGTNPVWIDSNGDGLVTDDELFDNGEAIKLPQSFATTGTANTQDGTFTTDANGFFETTANALPFSTYHVEEVIPPAGYATDGNSITETDFTIDTDQEIKELKTNIYNDVYTGTFDLLKMINSSNNGHSTTSKPEAGIEFTALLKKTVDEKFNGDFAAAYKAIFHEKPNEKDHVTPDDSNDILNDNGTILFSKKEYDVLTTNNSGMAYSRDLAYGEYYIYQTSHTDSVQNFEGNVTTYEGATFKVTKEHQDPIHFYVTNLPMLYKVKMVKVATQTGELITLNNTSFKIKDSNGNYLTQKVGNKTYDTFTTVTKKMVVDAENGKKITVDTGTFVSENPDADDKATAYTALGLEAGRYTLTEVKTPEGFVTSEDIPFEVKESAITEVDEYGENFITIPVNNDQITGKLIINKDVSTWSSDKTFINHEDLSGIGFTLTAAEDVLDPANGEVLVKAGQPAVRIANADAQNVDGINSSRYETVGEIFVDKDGKASVDNLPLGKYTLTETTVPDGIIPSDPIEVEFKQENGNTEKAVYPVTEKIGNDTTKVIFKKTDVAGKEIGGAKMSLTDSSDNTIVEWTSEEGKDFRVEGLKIGESYILHEDLSPLGYVKASDLHFTVHEDGSVTEETMIDKVVTIDKTDGEGNELPGANITITDEDGNVVDTWTSTDTPHPVNNLEEGRTYTWHEDYSPDLVGYYYTEDYTFTVTDEKINVAYEMVDSPIRYQIAKVDDNGNYVKGVTLKLTDISDLKNPTEIELPNNGVTEDQPFLLDKKLTAEHTYELVESEYVAGVYKATSLQFTVPKYGKADVTTITMEDITTSVAVTKLDNHGNPVKEAHLSILEATEKEDGTIVPVSDDEGNPVSVYNWITNDRYEDISSYVKGSNEESGNVWYILRETESPFGFNAMEDIPFTVTGTQDQRQVIVGTDIRKNYYVSALKVDSDDESKKLEGAEFTLYTKDNQIAKDTNGKACVNTTDKNGQVTFHVEYNGDTSGYYLKETTAPSHYQLNTDKFEVQLSEDYDFASNNPIKISVKDKQIPSVQTGVQTHIPAYSVGLIASIGLISFLIRKRFTK